ncbi:MAG TPA: hypothetical protein VLI90_13910 [Tepidisphaeraceae bacterium]|nr:hypothetical protein [Tepidisphaeraceae bacterium]
MASARFYVLSSVAVMGVAAVLGGCTDQNKGSSYPPPNTPSSSYQSSSYQSSSTVTPAQQNANDSSAQTAGMTTPPPVRVPAGARMVSAGPYPPPSFNASEGGTLYIWDDDENKIALVTSVGNSDVNRNVNIADMPNVSNALNNKHRFRVYYVPTSAATTLPSSLGQ